MNGAHSTPDAAGINPTLCWYSQTQSKYLIALGVGISPKFKASRVLCLASHFSLTPSSTLQMAANDYYMRRNTLFKHCSGTRQHPVACIFSA
jgi:hypothetical protein